MTKEEAAFKFRQNYLIPNIYDGDYRLALEEAFLAGVTWEKKRPMIYTPTNNPSPIFKSTREKQRVYVLSGSPSDLSKLYLETTYQLTDAIEFEVDSCSDDELPECLFQISVVLMTRKQIDNLPEYEY